MNPIAYCCTQFVFSNEFGVVLHRIGKPLCMKTTGENDENKKT